MMTAIDRARVPKIARGCHIPRTRITKRVQFLSRRAFFAPSRHSVAIDHGTEAQGARGGERRASRGPAQDETVRGQPGAHQGLDGPGHRRPACHHVQSTPAPHTGPLPRPLSAADRAAGCPRAAASPGQSAACSAPAGFTSLVPGRRYYVTAVKEGGAVGASPHPMPNP